MRGGRASLSRKYISILGGTHEDWSLDVTHVKKSNNSTV